MRVDGFIGPSHVSTVIGSRPYEFFAEEYQRPVVIAGFEPLDVMQAILMLVRQVNEGRAARSRTSSRARSTRDGNAQGAAPGRRGVRAAPEFRVARPGRAAVQRAAIQATHTPHSTPSVASRMEVQAAPDNPACECGAILRGVKKPTDCKLFGTACTPDTPMGSCMVSPEGACAAHWTYGRFRDDNAATQERRMSLRQA